MKRKKKTDKESYSFLKEFSPHVFTQVKGFVYSSKALIQWACVL